MIAETATAIDIGILKDLVSRARAAGADAADAVGLASRSVGVGFRLGALEEVERSESAGYGLRVLIGRRQAAVSTSDPGIAARKSLVERAVAMARAAPQDPCAGLAEKELLARKIDSAALEICDETEASEDRLRDLAARAEDAARAVPGVTNSGGSGAGATHSEVVLVTSHGFAGRYRGSSFSVSVSVLAGEGTAMERDYDFSTVRFLDDLDSPEEVGRRAGERAVARLRPVRPATRRMPVVFDPRVAASLLGHFAQAVNGAGVARGTSFLKDSMGAQLFAPMVSIIDDPLRPRGLASRPFDGEGVACRTTALVESGVLKSWVLDSATGRKLGLPTTGHARRDLSSPPSPGTTNLYMAPGPVTRDELIGEITQGIYVSELIGMGVNPVTGDYSRGAAGFVIENGELARPASEFTIAANLRDMFRNLLPASDLEFRQGTNAPTCRVEGMTVAGR